MFKVCLAGAYPAGTYESIVEALPADTFEVVKADTQEKMEAVTDADVIILRILKMAKESFAHFTNLKMVMRWGVGYDSVDIEEAGLRGVLVCNTPGANAYAVADLAVALMLNVGRNIFGYYDNIRKNQWDRNAFSTNLSLNGKTVGLIGGGNIGRQVAKRVQAFGSKVCYYDAFRLPEAMEQEAGLTYCELDELIRCSDVISLHVPLLDSTRHIIGAEQLAMMKPNTVVINTARGGLIDDAALAEALKNGTIGGAGLDCVEEEEGKTTEALLEMPNVIITPHIGGSASDLGSAIIPMLVENIVLLQAEKPVKYIVNQQYLKAE